jgi:hypothetical protein
MRIVTPDISEPVATGTAPVGSATGIVVSLEVVAAESVKVLSTARFGSGTGVTHGLLFEIRNE